MDGEVCDRTVRQHMRDVAECVLKRVEPGVCGDVDMPFGDILPVMAAGRQPQDLDHTRGRRLVAVAGGMGNSQAHGLPLFLLSFRGAKRTRNLEIPGLVLRTIRNDGLISDTAW